MSVSCFDHLDDFVDYFRQYELLTVRNELVICHAERLSTLKNEEARYLGVKWNRLNGCQRLHFFIHLVNQLLLPLGRQLTLKFHGNLGVYYFDGTLLLVFRGKRPLQLRLKVIALITRVSHLFQATFRDSQRSYLLYPGDQLVLYRRRSEWCGKENLIPYLMHHTPEKYTWECTPEGRIEAEEGVCDLYIRKEPYVCMIFRFLQPTLLKLTENKQP